jgi:hypothetical protein
MFRRTVTETIEIDAPPIEVWAVLTDLSAYPEWNPHIREGAGEVAVGRRLTLRMYPARGRPVTIRPTVIAAEPGTELRLLGRLPGIFSAEHRFTLNPLHPGTRVVQSEVYRGLIVPFLGKTIAASRTSFRAHNQALKERAETLAR